MQGHMLVMTLTWYINSFPWYCHKGRVSELTLLLWLSNVVRHPDIMCVTYHLCLRHADMIWLTKQKNLSTREIQVMDQKGLLVIMSAVLKLSGYCWRGSVAF